ncbi:MAG: M23 family metallopeptidase [Phycisphaerae bacterium]|nr:M23 family metallopeptidase [Phycisphaerae bacterium]
MLTLALSLALLPAPLDPPSRVGHLVASGGGPIGQPTDGHTCVPAWQEAEIQAVVAANVRALGLVDPTDGALPPPVPPPLVRFFPHAVNLFDDAFMQYTVDLNPAAGGVMDFACASPASSYDGHNGNDSVIRSFGEQAYGVPVYAALPGTVVARADGFPDMNTTMSGQPANYVVVQHADGSQAWYLHLRNGSVLPAVGQHVRLAEQIGLTGSSGNSSVPHLHFELRDSNGTVFEPWATTPASACRPGSSGFVQQPAFVRTFYANDFGFTQLNIGTLPATQLPPYALPRTGHKAPAETNLYIWTIFQNLPANATWQFTFKRPNGTTAFTSGQVAISNGATPQRTWWQWTSFFVNDLNSSSFLGTWRISVTLTSPSTGTVPVVTDAPLELRSVRSATYNRPPNAFTVSLDPPAPTATDAVYARVSASRTLDDPDYDILRYRYVWKRSGVIVRDVTHAGRSDAVPAGTLQLGSVLRCEVTCLDPLDASTAAAPAQFTVTVGPCPADLGTEGSPDPLSGPDGFITGTDFDVFILAFFAELRTAGGLLLADLTNDTGTGGPDGFITGADFDRFILSFFGGC